MESNSRCLLCTRPNPKAQLRLFCFHHAGGSPTIFHPWKNSLPDHIELWVVRIPGRGDRAAEPPFKRIAPVVQEVSEALVPFLKEPFALYGHSMGAAIAFETARLVRRRHGAQPTRLLVSSCQAPQRLYFALPTYDLPEAEFIEELRSLNSTPQPLFADPRLLLTMLPTIRADVELLQTYEYLADAPLDCPITVFGGLQDQIVELAGLMGWRKQTTAQSTLHLVPGDHFFIKSYQQDFLELLSDELNASIPRSNGAQAPRQAAWVIQ